MEINSANITYKYYFTFLFLLSLFSCVNAQEKTIQKAVIKEIDFYISTFFTIHCDEFGKKDSSVKTHTITDEKSLHELYNIVRNLKENHNAPTPDVRAKIFIWYNDGTEDILCLSLVAAELNGSPILSDTSLIKFVKKYQK